MSTPDDPTPPGHPGYQPPPGQQPSYSSPPAGGYGPPQGGGYGQQPPSEKRSKKGLLIGSIVALLIVAGLGVFFFIQGDAQAGEVFLVPAASAGPDPFSETPFAEPPDPAVALPASATSPPPPANPNPQPVAATSGAQPGLYGGTRNSRACDPDQMVAFLGANPDKAQAWVNALTADSAVRLRDGRALTTATIPDYVAGLTSFVLLADTRVTNHGFKNGRQTVLQSVLQKGSAVMVDEYGVPRVKCYCGNPLLPPAPSRRQVTYKGPPWPDFDPNRVQVVSPPPTPVENFTACDPRDPSNCFNVPPGGGPPGPVPPDVPERYEMGNPPPQGMVSNDPPEYYEEDESGREYPDYPDDYVDESGVEEYTDLFESPEYYAQTAVDQFNEMKRLGCGFSGVYWNGDYNSHLQWASGQSSDRVRMDYNERERQLNTCR